MKTDNRSRPGGHPADKGRGRGRPTPETAEAITHDLLDAAEELFLQNGFDVTLQSVALAADVSRTALYARFSTKEALLVGVVKRLVEDWSARTVLSGAEERLPVEPRLTLTVCRTLKVMATDKGRRLNRLVQTNRTRSPALLALVTHLGVERGIANFAAIMADGRDDRSETARRAAFVLIQMLLGWISTTDERIARQKVAQEHAARSFVGILLHGSERW